VRLGRATSAESHASWYTPTVGLQDSSVREVVRLMLPRIAGIGVVQLNFWVNTWLASLMPDGSVAGLQYGFSLMLMAQAAIAQSVAIAAMPTFSAQHALGRQDELRASLTAALRGIVLLAAPASAGLVLLRQPMVALLYERGQFDERMTALVAWALLWYGLGLLGHSMLEVLTRAYYAQRDTRTPVIVGASAMGLNVLLSIGLARLFGELGWMPHGGLALANSMATALEMSALLWLMHRRLGGLDLRRLRSAAVQAGLGVAAMCAVLIPIAGMVKALALATVGGVLFGGAVYALVMRLLRVPELSVIASALARRMRA
jgi:putative peptidoglycan lipid II flippase